MNVDTNKLKVKRTDLNSCNINLSIEIDADTVKSAFDTALVQIHSRVQMPGFRVGRVPLNTVKENFKEQIKDRALELVVKNSLTSVLEQEKINPISTPMVQKVDYRENKPLKFDANIETAPKIEPKNYENINISKPSLKVTDELLKQELENIRRHNARLEAETENTPVSENNYAVVDFKAYKGDKELPEYSQTGEIVDMSSPQTIKGLAECIKGAKKGETRQFQTELKNENITFKITVNEIKKKILPELNDDFAKEINYENYEKLKTHILELMSANMKRQTEEKMIKQIEEHLVKHNDFDMPQSLIEQNTDLHFQRMLGSAGNERKIEISEEQKNKYRQQLRPAVERDLKIAYLLHAIAEKENIKVTDEELKKELDISIEKAKTDKEKEHIRQVFDSKKQNILLAVKERKVFDFLKSKAKITEG